MKPICHPFCSLAMAAEAPDHPGYLPAPHPVIQQDLPAASHLDLITTVSLVLLHLTLASILPHAQEGTR